MSRHIDIFNIYSDGQVDFGGEWTERTNSFKMNIMDSLSTGFSFYFWAVQKIVVPIQSFIYATSISKWADFN